jgi:hypothetical protein
MRHDDPLQTEAPYAPGGDAVDSDDAPIASGDESSGPGGLFDPDGDADVDELTGDDVEEDELGI